MTSDLPSSELLPVLSSLTNLKHIIQHLSKNPYHAVIHKFASIIDMHCYEKILQKVNLTSQFISQFEVDLAALGTSLSPDKKSLFPQSLTFLES